MNIYIKYIFAGLIFLFILVTLSYFLKNKYKADNNMNIFPDTTIVTRFKTELKRDTVVQWYEKIIYDKPVPKNILIQKADSAFFEKSKQMNLILQIKKAKDKLTLRAINQADSLIKEYNYDNVGNDFIATANKNNIILKTRKFYWNGFNLNANFEYELRNLQIKHPQMKIGLISGINYNNKIYLNTGINYNVEDKSLELLLGINYKLVK
jgi:hypothetical protein